MAEFVVSGDVQAVSTAADPSLDGLLTVRTAREVNFGVTRSSSASEAFEVHDDDVLELELENGIRLWVPGDEAEDVLEVAQNRAGKPEFTGALRIGQGQAATRGALDWVLKGLKLLDIDPIETGADIAALALAAKIEERAFAGDHVPRPGLYRAATPYDLSPVTPEQIRSDRPIAIFVHGTGSTTAASFGQLAGADAEAALRSPAPFWEEMRKLYGDEIYALQHRTLTDSPVRNALELAEALPPYAELHLVTYSRGGLVGELMARSGSSRTGDDGGVLQEPSEPIDARDLEIFARAQLKKGSLTDKTAHHAAREKDIEDLKRLNELLKAKAPRVTRFVRVACPTRGTTLASGRLDKYLTLVLNLLEYVPFLKDNPIVGLTKAFLLAVVKTRTRPEVIPGLEAMMPNAPLIAMVNRTDVRLESPLTAIAGDIDPSGFLNALKVYAADLYYPDDHDLVVDTDAMVGGSLREPAARYFFDKGSDVNHFAYFSNERTRTKIREALAGEDSGFHVLDERRELTVRAAPKAHDPASAPHVFLLPGIMGTHLGLGGNRIWLDYFDMALGGIRKLDLDHVDGKRVRPHNLIGAYYDDLAAYLEQTHVVHRFPYDWRQPITESGAALNASVAQLMVDIAREIETRPTVDGETLTKEQAAARARTVPIRFVAHSMGGLVVRAMRQAKGSVWGQLCKREGTRVVMLGTPNQGSHSVVSTLLGEGETVRQLSLLDITSSRNEVLNVIGRIPGFVELLPGRAIVDEERDGQYFDPAVWATFSEHLDPDGKERQRQGNDETWPPPDPKRLSEAAELSAALGDFGADLTERLFYVAGSAPATPVGVRIDPHARRGRRVKILNSVEGDGRVSWQTGIPDGLEERKHLYYSEASHGDLSRHKPDFPAIVDLLSQGETTRLPRTPRTTRSDRKEVFEHVPPIPPRPDHRTLSFIGMGGGKAQPPPGSASPSPEVEIVHGDLAFCGRVIAAGHYENDVLVGAEAFIDKKLGGRLSDRRRLGLYPGRIGTGEVVINREGRERDDFPGALIVGLGRIGELDVEGLTRCMSHGFMLYALRLREQQAHRAEKDRMAERKLRKPLSAELATLLVGHQESRISLRDSIRAVLEALLRANAALAEKDRIRKLRFVELFDDIAVEAAGHLQREAENPRFAGLDINYRLREMRGARRRVGSGSGDDWIQRIDIRVSDRKGEEGSLRFTTHSGTAIAAEDLVVRNRDEIDAFVDAMTAETRGSEHLSHLLFERLFPSAIKRIYSGGRPIQLTLDEQTASYPWELLENPFSETPEPIAVNNSIVRQLRQDRGDLIASPAGADGVLIVGDPKSDFPPLPGARAEAERVHKLFEHDRSWSLSPALIEPSGLEVQAALLLNKHRLIHLAGHGVCSFTPPQRPDGPVPESKTGMVLGPGSFLTADMIGQMSFPPEFVFLNCCHLGRLPHLDEFMVLRQQRHRLAASLAVQFMRCGAKAVIAAGWEVEDAPAAAFAECFYKAMLEGEAFGDAVTAGRRAAYHLNPKSNTWGAYQCYGDPDFRIGKRTRRSGPGGPGKPFAAMSQALVEIENVSKEAATSAYTNTRDDEEALLARLDRIDARLAPSWRGSPELLASIGHAYGELNAFDKAIAHYERAISAEKTAAPIRVIEQLANYRARQAATAAVRQVSDRREARSAAVPVIQRSIDDIGRLIDTGGPTKERYLILASAWKRMSMVREYDDLEHAVANYANALDVSRRVSGGASFDPNPAINARLCAVVCRLYSRALDSKRAENIASRMEVHLSELPSYDEIHARLVPRRIDHANFWDLAMLGDLELARGVETGDLAKPAGDTTGNIIAAYRRAWVKGGSSREFSSVVETIRFILVIWERKQDKIPRDLAALQQILDALTAFEGFNERC